MEREHLPIGDNIRLLRNRLGFSQEYIASRLGISKQRYRQLESEEEQYLTIGRLLDIALILETDLDTIINLHRMKFLSNRFNIDENQSQLEILVELVKTQKSLIEELQKIVLNS